jgi:hypothetical protein
MEDKVDAKYAPLLASLDFWQGMYRPLSKLATLAWLLPALLRCSSNFSPSSEYSPF